MDEKDIRSGLEASIKRKTSFSKRRWFWLSEERYRNKIIKPCVDDDFNWNYESIKRLVGQGKLSTILSKKLTKKVVLEIDLDCLLFESFQFFKSNSFQPDQKLKVIFKNQLANDAGGWGDSSF